MKNSQISLASLANASYATLVNVATGQEREVSDAQVSALVASNKWKLKAEPITNGANDPAPVRTATALRKDLSRADRKKLSDANRSESLVIPNAISDDVKDDILIDPIECTILQFIEKKSRNTGNLYSACQVSCEYNGETYKFCILDQPDNVEFEKGNIISLLFAKTTDPNIRSGVNYEVVA